MKCLAKLAHRWINIANECVDVLWVHKAAVTREISSARKSSNMSFRPEKYGACFERDGGIASGAVRGAYES
jgi:hypothetical protein